MVRANDMRKAENPMETPLATDAGLVFIGCIHPPWTSRMETPVVFGGLLVDQLATHDRSRCSGDLCDVPGHSSLAAVEPREKGSRVLLIAVYLVLPRSEENTALLMTDLWSFDLCCGSAYWNREPKEDRPPTWFTAVCTGKHRCSIAL